jgi:hypothetical protein
MKILITSWNDFRQEISIIGFYFDMQYIHVQFFFFPAEMSAGKKMMTLLVTLLALTSAMTSALTVIDMSHEMNPDTPYWPLPNQEYKHDTILYGQFPDFW